MLNRDGKPRVDKDGKSVIAAKDTLHVLRCEVSPVSGRSKFNRTINALSPKKIDRRSWRQTHFTVGAPIPSNSSGASRSVVSYALILTYCKYILTVCKSEVLADA
jgi:hypothetical protein